MKVEKIDHAAIMVKDLEQAEKFFADLFETEFSPWAYREGEEEEPDSRNLISPLGIELATPVSPNGPAKRLLDNKGEGLFCLVLKVPNLEEAIAEMESHGVRLIRRGDLPSSSVWSFPKVALFHPKDVYGVMIELIEY